MGKDFIGKRIRLQIGGNPKKDDDSAVVGEDVNVRISSEEAAKYDNITGEKVEVRIGGDVNTTIQKIMSTIQQSNEKERETITAICREILAEKDKQTKIQKIRQLISIGANIASIAQLVLQLKTIG